MGKQDIYDEGSGNVHKNYNYSIPQNRQNLDDLTKVSCKIKLPSANFNLYLFQKILLLLKRMMNIYTRYAMFMELLMYQNPSKSILIHMVVMHLKNYP
jgi:hypothetical protein